MFMFMLVLLFAFELGDNNRWLLMPPSAAELEVFTGALALRNREGAIPPPVPPKKGFDPSTSAAVGPKDAEDVIGGGGGGEDEVDAADDDPTTTPPPAADRNGFADVPTNAVDPLDDSEAAEFVSIIMVRDRFFGCK